MSARLSYRLGLAVTLGTALVLAFGIAALGVVGAGGRDDLPYAGVLGVLLLGALAVRLRPRGMTVVLAVAAVTTLAAMVGVLAAGLQDTEGASTEEIVRLSVGFAVLFGLGAALFRRADTAGA